MMNRYKVGLSLFSFVALLLLSCSKPVLQTKVDNALVELSSMDEQDIPGYLESLERTDPIAPYYRNPFTSALHPGVFHLAHPVGEYRAGHPG